MPDSRIRPSSRRPAARPTASIGLNFLISIALLLAVVTTTGCGSRYQHVVERELPASTATDDGLMCTGYLAWNNEPVRDVFLVINGSGALSNAFVHPSFKGLISTHRIAYSTYDKPGIRAPFDDPAAVRRDDALFQRYTLGHGIACAIEALRWARTQFGPSLRLHVRAHSEGTLIALYAYDELLDREPELAAKVATFVLSGLALEPFADILERQLATAPNGGRWREAIASCDWPVLKKNLGISCAYIEDAKQRPSGRAVFERLATRAPAAKFYVFQGTKDWNTPVASVRALEAWSSSEGQQRLKMEFHYYEGGHAGTDEARAEATRLLTTIVSAD